MDIMGDTATHLVWVNPSGQSAVSVKLEKSTDGVNFSILDSAILSGIPDIFALYFPQDIDYFDTILYSTESNGGGYLYNDILKPSDPDTLYYRIVLTDSDSVVHYFRPESVSRLTGEQIMNNVFSPVKDSADYSFDGLHQKKGGMKALCNNIGTVPTGYTPTGQTQTIIGTCCYYVNSQYTSTSIQIVCGGGSVAWCCASVPGAQNCPSGMKYDYCCAHTCGQYPQCVCATPWQCCSMSQATVWVVTQSYNYPGITLSATIVNETCAGTHNGSIAVAVNAGTNPITYSWTGGYPNSPNLTNLPAGSYTVTVTDAHNCTAAQTFIVSTSPPPVATLSAIPSMCINAAPFTLTGGSPAGGFYSGAGVTNGVFNPTAAGAGNHVITYTYTDPNNCVGTATTTITVNALPAVTFSTIGPFCLNASPITLTQGNPAGGAYTGQGISNGVFSPTGAGVGTFNLSYVYTDSHLCTNSATQTVTVNAMPIALVNPIPPVCIDAAPFALNNGVPSGGVFAGSGINNNTFNPTVAGAGVHAVVYFYSDGNQCSDTAFQTVTVYPLPTVSLPAFSDMCINASTITLSGASPTGGTYYVDGIQSAVFNPSVAGAGVHMLLYVYSDGNSCTDSASATIKVNPLPVVTSTPLAPVCADVPAFSLAFGSPAGGDYSGPGVSSGLFNPAVSGSGTFAITYTYPDPLSGCINSVTETIQVNPLPVVSFAPIAPVCVYSQAFTLGGGTPAGGIFAGPGVSGTTFDPAIAGVGTHSLTYTFTDSFTGCVNEANQSIIVKSALAMSTLPSYISICPGASANLSASGALNYSWMPSAGLSTTASSFVTATPQSTTTYTVLGTDAVGCTGSAIATVNVYPPVNINTTAEPMDGCMPLTVRFSYNVSPNDSSAVWMFDDPYSGNNTATGSSPVHTFENAGSYHPVITVVSYYGCFGTSGVTVNAYRPPIADFYPNPELVDMTYPLIDFIDQSVSANRWYWDFGDPASIGNNNSELQSPSHTYVSEGIHEVKLIVESGHNCDDTIIKTVEVLPEMLVFIPNAVSPNGDGINDVWKPVFTNTDAKAYSLHLYDGWGKELWKTTNPAEAWDCSFNGETVKEGVYVWIVFFRDPRGKDYKRTGIVSVLP
ncbi:MAG: gliding motility-associated C-terminal domain-containing protein [Bacteroidota bacterium]